MTQIQSATERDATIVAQEIARAYTLTELYDPQATFVRLCAQVQEVYLTLSDAALYRVVARALRKERERRKRR